MATVTCNSKVWGNVMMFNTTVQFGAVRIINDLVNLRPKKDTGYKLVDNQTGDEFRVPVGSVGVKRVREKGAVPFQYTFNKLDGSSQTYQSRFLTKQDKGSRRNEDTHNFSDLIIDELDLRSFSTKEDV